jgi:geranylgeranyl pyrophosphate synthase
MNLKEIYQPISNELSQVEIELKNVVRNVGQGFSLANSKPKSRNLRDKGLPHKIINHFFKVSGKRLRPALVLLSAKSINCGLSTVDNGLIRLAVAVELIHSASLIHDDIIDNESFRRGQPSLNKQFGNQTAVLVGDMLYTCALSLLFGKVDNEIINILLQCVEKMTLGELYELEIANCELRDAKLKFEIRNPKSGIKIAKCELRNAKYKSRTTNHKPQVPFNDYLKIIENKTASLMSACCECAAILVCPENIKTISALKEYGFNFGMAYQLIDDYLDVDISIDSELNLVEKAKEYAECAKESIKFLPDSEYKKSLENFVDFITNVQNEAYSFNSR